MGIVMFPYEDTYIPVASADVVEQINHGNSFFQQGKRSDVSKYDLRQVRRGNRKGRSECEVLHAKAECAILFNGSSYPASGEHCYGVHCYTWRAYPNVTIMLESERQYHGPGHWSWQNWGTCMMPRVHVFYYASDDGTNARVTHGYVAWVAPLNYENPVAFGRPSVAGDMYFTSIYNVLVRHNCVPQVINNVPYFRRSTDTTAVTGDNEFLNPYDWDWWAQVIRDDYHDTGQGAYRCDLATLSSVDPEFSWLLLENGYPNGYGRINYAQSGHYRQLMIQHAYLDALSSVEHAWDNGVSNVAELAKFCYNLFHNHRVEMPKNWKDTWLSYRYVYSTTKLDTEELVGELQNNLREVLKEGKRYVKVRGTYNMEVSGVQVTCHVSVFLKNRVYDFLDKCLITLEEWGLKPDLYLAWDMTPYSFVVDWFLPIGNTLNAVDAAYMYNGSNSVYDIGPITYSFSYTQDIEGSRVRNYSRGVLDELPVQALYWFVEPSSTSMKTWGKRVIDSAALFT